jgi:WD40 repeat protein/serine/threonine protein kinase
VDERSLFLAALDKPAAERAAFLKDACPDAALRSQVEALLRAHEKAQGFLEEPAAGTGEFVPEVGTESSAQPPLSEGPGTRVGPYKLLQPIGEGGMGAVFMAEQENPVRRMVALKVIKPGMDSRQVVARFEQERQALALMDHPNIAKVLDAGTTGSGRPFFVMELVKGVPITKYCDQQHLTPRERLELFIPVCQAVQHAHQKGVIHRDLKPSNVLIALYDGRPVPKVIDFGVAKATSQKLTERTMFTEFGQVIGTLEYMSPEQAELNQLDVDTRSDIYSLGVLLYELLTGTTPFDRGRLRQAAFDEVLRIIREEEPPKPSTRLSHSDELPNIAANRRTEPKKLGRLMRGELDWVVMKCLEKDRARRYETANGVARDIERYLTDEPVEAGPPSARYRLAKFARKNRRLLATAAAFVLLLAAAAGVSAWLAVEANRSAERADTEAKNATESARLAQKEAARADREAQNAKEATAREKQRADGEQAARRGSQRLLGLMNVDQGLREADEGRPFLALLRIAQPLVVDADDPPATEMARVRLANYRQYYQPGPPVLTQVWFLPAPVKAARFSRDGRRVVTVCNEAAQVWDAATGQAVTPPLTHANDVHSAAFSPDGGRVVTASQDNTARVWDAATGRAVSPPLRHGDAVMSAVFSPDGDRVVTACQDGTAQVWDAATGQAVIPPFRHGESVRLAAFSPDGRRVVTAGSTTVRLWDVASGRSLTPPLSHEPLVESVAFSPDGQRVVTGGYLYARVWDAATGRPLIPPLMHEGMVGFAAFSPDGRRVLTAGLDKVQVWDAANGRPIRNLPGGTAVFSPDGRRVVTASNDRTARVWDAATGQPLSPPLPHGGPVRSAAFSPDGRRLVTASDDRTARVWDTATGRPAGITLAHEARVHSAAFSPDGRRLVTSADRTARVWNAATGQPVSPPLLHGGPVQSAAFSPDGRRVVTASDDRTARVWDAATGQSLIPWLSHQGIVQSAAFSPDGRRVVTASADGIAQVWDAATGQPVAPLLAHRDRVKFAAFSPDGRRLVTVSDNRQAGAARIWDATSGQPLTPPLTHAGEVLGKGVLIGYALSTVFSQDGGRVVTAGYDRTARIWDAITGQPVCPPLTHRDFVSSAAFSPDSRRLVTSAGRTVRVWDAATGQPITIPLTHRNIVYSAAFSPDGRRLVTHSDQSAIVWDAATGQPVTPPLPNAAGLQFQSAGFSPDGWRVVTGGSDKTARIWDVSPDPRPVGDLPRLAQLLSNHRIDDTGAAVPLSGEELKRLWDDLRPRYPADFAVSPAAARAWREREIGDCLREGNLAAAEFHYWWLVAEMALAAQPVK